MKKFIITIITLVFTFSFCACLTSCKTPQENNVTIYTRLSQMLNSDYDSATLNVTTKNQSYTLKSNFSITYLEDNSTKIDYLVQQISQFEQVDGNMVAPEGFYTTKEGSVTIFNNQVVELNGDQISLDFAQVSKVNFDFTSTNFSNVKLTNTSFVADVTNPKSFLNAKDFDGQDLSVTIIYAQKISSITLNYTTANNSQVKIYYTLN